MTREEAIAHGKEQLEIFGGEHREFINMAIEALKQGSILAEVRDEIENDWQFKKYPSSPFSCGLRRAIEIIDKYKEEGEKEA